MPPHSTAISHHYVPQWYQRRFIDPTVHPHKLFYLDQAPEQRRGANGRPYFRTALRHLGPGSCFQADHLYTLNLAGTSVELETRFFGKLDRQGSVTVPFFSDLVLRGNATEQFHPFLRFADAQKSRTPKGLDLLKAIFRTQQHHSVLYLMHQLSEVNCTIWTECVWEIVRCDNSATKFILSDHPVTTYNKGLFPGCKDCRYPLDAPIELLGTHTLFPLSLTRCLVMTNLGYVRDPEANPKRRRENPRYFKDAIFDMRSIQTGREISEDYVLAINLILKKRSRRYIAAARKEWLYPESKIGNRRWDKLGDRFFLMPDPRKVSFHTDTLMGFENDVAWGVDEYGRPPLRADPSVSRLREREWQSFSRAQRSWDAAFGKLSPEESRKALFGF